MQRLPVRYRSRRVYIEQLLSDAGVAPPLAATRAQLLYWAYLGAALSHTRLTGEQLNQTVAELKQVGLASSTPAAPHYKRTAAS